MKKSRISLSKIFLRIAVTAAFWLIIASVQDVHAAENNNTHGFYYDCLTGAEETAYDTIVKACTNRTTDFECKPFTNDQFWNAYDAVRFDHPEFYWLHNYDLTTFIDKDNMIVKVKMNIPSDAGVWGTVLEAAADNEARLIKDYGSDYDKYKEIYSYVMNHASYGRAKGVDDQSITGIMINELGVCSGYADTFKYLCDRAGLFCIKVVGNTSDYNGGLDPETHAWNMIRIDGSYYWVDVTWGDTSKDNDQTTYGTPDQYSYFCATDAKFLKDHYPSATLLSNSKGHFKVSYPACQNEQYTSFSLQGLQFNCVEDSYGYIGNAISAGIPYVQMQFSSTDELYRAIDVLHGNGVIWDIVNGTGVYYSSYTYFYNPMFDTLLFEFA